MLENNDSDDGMRELRAISNDPNPSLKSIEKLFEDDNELESESDNELEKRIFGDKTGLVEKFEIQTGSIKQGSDNQKRKAAWRDSDDEDFKIGDVLRPNKRIGSLNHLDKEKTYKNHLTKKFDAIVSTPKWAALDRELTDDSDEEILHTVGHINKSVKSEYLSSTALEFKQLKDLNRETYAEGSIYDIQFHPTSTAALVSGQSGIVSIYSIDGLKNDKLHSVKFNNFPIKCSRMLVSGEEALIGGIKNYYYSYDLLKTQEQRIFLPKTITKLTKFETSPCGKYFVTPGRFGEIFLLDLVSKELLYTFKQEDPCTALKFTNDSNRIITHSSGSILTVLNLRQQRIENQMIDDGCIIGKTLDISPNGEWLATGSNEGVVNIYNYTKIFDSDITNGYLKPKPEKTFYNLTTSISCTKFNHSSEVLGYCSEDLPGAVKLIHLPSATVYSNFPMQRSKLGNIRVIEFSPNSGFMAMGNVKKQVPLYRLKHFNNY